jgi:predicted deacylase
MPPVVLHVKDYFDSRVSFRALSDELRWARETHAIAARGPAGEELTIDVAWSTDEGELPTLVLSTGLHGVEGFFGSDVLLNLLKDQRGERRVQIGNVRLVLIHALNPFGFAHVRRFDAENIDPNRNFLLPHELFSGSPPDYAELDSLINPRTPSGGWDGFLWQAAGAIWRMGMPRLKQAIAAGQYDYPQGLFFGGHGPCETQRILAALLPRWLAGAPRVVHLDFHTGLGRRRTAKLLIDSPLTPAQQAWLDEHLDRENYEACDSAGVAYRARGGFGPWCAAHSGVPDYLYACAEFGTYSPLTVLQALRAENREHHFGRPGSPSYLRAKERLRRAFTPHESAVTLALDWIEEAVVGLTEPA